MGFSFAGRVGILILALGVPASGQAYFRPNHLFVASVLGNKIFEFNLSGALIRTFNGGGNLSGLEGLAFGPDGRLYVASSFDDSIRVLNPDGTLFKTLLAQARLNEPTGLAFGPGGELYVASTLTDRVVVISTQDDSVLAEIGGNAGLDGPEDVLFGMDGHYYVSSCPGDSVLEFASNGTRVRTLTFGADLDCPHGLAFATGGVLAIASTFAHKMIFSFRDGTGSAGPVGGNDNPFYLTTGPDGRLWIGIDNANLVRVFEFGDFFKEVGAGAGLSLVGGLAFSPFVFRVRVKGKLFGQDNGGVASFRSNATLLHAPGSGTLMLHFVDDPDRSKDYPSLFHATDVVLHGMESGHDTLETRRTFAGNEVRGSRFGSIHGSFVAAGRNASGGGLKERTMRGTISVVGPAAGTNVATLQASVQSRRLLN